MGRDKEKAKLVKEIQKAMETEDFQKAIDMVGRLIKLDPGDIDSYFFKSIICISAGLLDDGREAVNSALNMAKKQWRDNPLEYEYETVEKLESFFDLMVEPSETEERQNSRFLEYAHGLLFFIGAAPFSVLKDLVHEITGLKIKMNQSQFAELIQGDSRFKVIGKRPMYVSLPEVEDPKDLFREFESRRLDYPEFIIDDLVDPKEAWAELFFDPAELDAIDRLRKITGAELPVGELHMIFNMERERPAMVVQKFLDMVPGFNSFERVQELTGIVMNLWNGWPRWELGGNFPSEVMEMERPYLRPLPDKPLDIREETGSANETGSAHESGRYRGDNVIQLPVRVNKAGRNDPCPCGSGKKYKKCCGREE